MSKDSVTMELDIVRTWDSRRAPPPAVHVTTLAAAQAVHSDWLPRLCELDNATRIGRPGAPRTPVEFAERLVELRLDPAWCFIAVRDDQWIGYTVLDPSVGDVTTVRQSWTGVRPEERRSGVATYLKEVAYRAAATAGYRRVRTVLARENQPAMELNRRLGFRLGAA